MITEKTMQALNCLLNPPTPKLSLIDSMKNMIGLFINLSRAYEIALLGNFSIQVVFSKEYTTGFEDYQKIKEFFNKVQFSPKGDLTVEIIRPDIRDNVRYESIEDIHQRVEAAKDNQKPTEFVSQQTCDALLKTAFERLELSIESHERIKKIASVIAQLEGKSKIETHHLAEAIQYQVSFMSDDGICNAENQSIQFGKGITIALHQLETGDIEQAIEYLKQQLP